MTTVWSGLILGSAYTLVAVTYNVVYTATGVFNWAQAQFVMLGTFVAFVGITAWHLPLPFVFVVALAIGAVIAVLEERVAIRPIQSKGMHGQMLTTLGAGVLIQGVVILIWGLDPRAVAFPGSTDAITLLGGRILPIGIVVIVVGAVAALGAEVYSRRTILGLASLATAEDRQAAAVRGINVGMLSVLAMASAGAIGVAVGPLLAPTTYAFASLGDLYAIKGFVALAIGGFGSQKGAMIGGFAIGLLEAGTARYVGVGYQSLAILAVLLLVLMLRPQGLFGSREARVV